MRTPTTSWLHGPTGVAALAAVALLASACGPDGPDAGLTGDAEPVADENSEEAVDEAAEVASTPAGDAEESADAAVETSPPNGEIVTVLAIDNTFIDEVVEVEAGTEILWTNNGRNDHDIIPVEPTQGWGIEIEDFPPGAEYSHVFTAPGEYPYYCSIHGTETVGMVGTIVVSG